MLNRVLILYFNQIKFYLLIPNTNKTNNLLFKARVHNIIRPDVSIEIKSVLCYTHMVKGLNRIKRLKWFERNGEINNDSKACLSENTHIHLWKNSNQYKPWN